MANGVEADKTELKLTPEKLNEKIIYQVEFYFGDYNLPKDKFLQTKTKENEGWVELDTLLTFNRMKSLTTDKEIITNALKQSKNDIIEISEDNLKVRRNPQKPLPESFKTEFLNRTVYVKGFPKDTTLDQLIEFFKPHGGGCVKMRRYSFNRQFKGSVLVLMETEESAKKLREMTDLKYQDMELLLMMAQEHADKKAAERKQSPKDKDGKKRSREENNDLEDMAKAEEIFQKMEKKKAVFLRVSGIPKENGDVSYQDIKTLFVDAGHNVGFVEFNKGDVEATVRFEDENGASNAFEKVAKEGKVTIKEKEYECKVLEGDAETAFYRKQAESKAQRFANDRTNRKRAGQNRQQGYRGKGGRGGNKRFSGGSRDSGGAKKAKTE